MLLLLLLLLNDLSLSAAVADRDVVEDRSWLDISNSSIVVTVLLAVEALAGVSPDFRTVSPAAEWFGKNSRFFVVAVVVVVAVAVAVAVADTAVTIGGGDY